MPTTSMECTFLSVWVLKKDLTALVHLMTAKVPDKSANGLLICSNEQSENSGNFVDA